MTVEQGGGPVFRVNVWDVVAVLLNTLTGIIGTIAGMTNGLAHLARGQSGYIDDMRDFREAASYDIEMITGDDNGR